jgi:hypothetical protein
MPAAVSLLANKNGGLRFIQWVAVLFGLCDVGTFEVQP